MKFIERILSLVLSHLLGGLELMLAVGIIRAEWIPWMPTIGYWWAVLIVLLLRGTFSRTRQEESK